MKGKKGHFSWSYNYTILLLCWLGWISIYLCRAALPPILPILKEELDLTHTQVGMFASSFMIGYILIKIPVGLLARRVGIKKALILSMVGYGFFTMLNAVATSFHQILIFRFFIGLFQGIHLPIANTLLSDRFMGSQGKAIGFHESGPNVGNTIALPLTVAIASMWSWRWGFILLSVPAFALSLATLFILKEEESKKECLVHLDTDSKEKYRLRSFLPLIIPLALAHAVYNLCLRALFNFTPIYLVEFRNMSLVSAGFISMILPMAGFFAKISSGFIADRFGKKKAICAATTFSSFFIASLTVLNTEYELALIFMLIGLALYSFSPTIYASVTASLPSQLKTTGLGLVTMTGNIAGAFSTPIIGFIIDIHGYNTAFLSISIITLLATVLIYITMRQDV